MKLNTTFGVIIQIVNNVVILQELIIRTNDFDCSIKRRDKRNQSSKMTFNILSSADQKSNNFLRIAITCNKSFVLIMSSCKIKTLLCCCIFFTVYLILYIDTVYIMWCVLYNSVIYYNLYYLFVLFIIDSIIFNVDLYISVWLHLLFLGLYMMFSVSTG